MGLDMERDHAKIIKNEWPQHVEYLESIDNQVDKYLEQRLDSPHFLKIYGLLQHLPEQLIARYMFYKLEDELVEQLGKKLEPKAIDESLELLWETNLPFQVLCRLVFISVEENIENLIEDLKGGEHGKLTRDQGLDAKRVTNQTLDTCHTIIQQRITGKLFRGLHPKIKAAHPDGFGRSGEHSKGRGGVQLGSEIPWARQAHDLEEFELLQYYTDFVATMLYEKNEKYLKELVVVGCVDITAFLLDAFDFHKYDISEMLCKLGAKPIDACKATAAVIKAEFSGGSRNLKKADAWFKKGNVQKGVESLLKASLPGPDIYDYAVLVYGARKETVISTLEEMDISVKGKRVDIKSYDFFTDHYAFSAPYAEQSKIPNSLHAAA